MTEGSQVLTNDCNLDTLPNISAWRYVFSPERRRLEYQEYDVPSFCHNFEDPHEARDAYETADSWIEGNGDESQALIRGEAICATSVEVVIYPTWLPRAIFLPDRLEVVQYISRYPDMKNSVGAICRTAIDKFGAVTQFSLELYHDPECEDEHLVLYVRQQNYDDNIMKTIEEIWEEHDDDFAAMSGWLLVTTDFQPPR